jgi:hypothetical protein
MEFSMNLFAPTFITDEIRERHKSIYERLEKIESQNNYELSANYEEG